MGCCLAGGGGPGIPAPPLQGCGKKLSTKKGAGPAESRDRAALIQGCPELEVPIAGAPSPQRMAPVATCTLSDFVIHFAHPPTLLHYGEWGLRIQACFLLEPNWEGEGIKPLEKSSKHRNIGITLPDPGAIKPLKTQESCLLIPMPHFLSFYKLGQEIT